MLYYRVNGLNDTKILFDYFDSSHGTLKSKKLKSYLLWKILHNKLLNKDNTFKKPNKKCYRSISKGHILIKDEFYTLSITESKRQLLYNSNNIFYNTKPLKL